MPSNRAPLAALLAATLAACASTPAPRPVAPTSAAIVAVPAISHPDGETAAWWFRDGAAQAAGRGAMDGGARNLILFVGDGMSLPTVAAARILDGQRKGRPGEGNRLAWETWPQTALSKTYNTDTQTPDSAGTMSAMATGVKTRAGVISIGQSARRGDCAGKSKRRFASAELRSARRSATPRAGAGRARAWARSSGSSASCEPAIARPR